MAKWSDNKYDRYGGQAPVAVTFSPAINFMIVSVKLHLSSEGGTAEDFTITLDSRRGTKFDANLLTQDMEKTVDLYWTPNKDLAFEDGDKIKFEYANTNARNFGLEIVYREGSR